MAGKPSGTETIKADSRALRGTIAEEVAAAEARGGLSEGAYTLLKFHGTYEQFDRDTATERKQRGEDKDWSFMVRVRAPAGRLGLPIPAGRVAGPLRAALRAVMLAFAPRPIVTAQQDLLLADIAPQDREAVTNLLRAHGVTFAEDLTPLARWTLACVALPTCGQSLAEGERVRGPILADVEAALARHGLSGERVSLRITGCPNGCARPYAGDIGVVGRAPGLYTLFVGGDFEGARLSFQLADKVGQASVAATLEPLFVAWAAERAPGEGFGDYCARIGQDAARGLLDAKAAA